MNTAGFLRHLAALGARFEDGTKHPKVYYRGKQSTVPRHRGIANLLAAKILKQPGMP